MPPVRSSKEVIENIFGSLEPAKGQPPAIKTLENVLVRDIMERRFVALNPQTTIRETVNVFLEKGIEGAPVMQEGLLKGLVTNQDIIKLFEEKSLELSQSRHKAVNYEKEFRVLGDKKITEVARRKVFVFPNTGLFDAMTVMDENNLELVAVVDESGKVQGVVNDADILKTILKALF